MVKRPALFDYYETDQNEYAGQWRRAVARLHRVYHIRPGQLSRQYGAQPVDSGSGRRF